MNDIKQFFKTHWKKFVYPVIAVLAGVLLVLLVIGMGSFLGGLFSWVGSLYAGMTLWEGIVATGRVVAMIVAALVLIGFMGFVIGDL